jgi:hypothetical protein
MSLIKEKNFLQRELCYRLAQKSAVLKQENVLMKLHQDEAKKY